MSTESATAVARRASQRRGQKQKGSKAGAAAKQFVLKNIQTVEQGLEYVEHTLADLRRGRTLRAATAFCMAVRILFSIVYSSAMSSGKLHPSDAARFDSAVDEGLTIYHKLDDLGENVPVYRYSIDTRLLTFRALVKDGREAAGAVLRARKQEMPKWPD